MKITTSFQNQQVPDLRIPKTDSLIQDLETRQAPQENASSFFVTKLKSRPYFYKGFNKDASMTRGVKPANLPALVIEKGTVNLLDVANGINNFDFIHCANHVCTISLPVVIEHGASLIIKGANSQKPLTVHLMSEQGAFLANKGELWVEHAHIESFSARSGRTQKDPGNFRPFITILEGGRFAIRDSSLKDLGYDGGMAYGLSVGVSNRNFPNRHAPPEGFILNSKLDGLYYAFYSWGAKDVQIIGNSIRNSIKYGIDPHDFSTGLVIAHNHVQGTSNFSSGGKPPGGHGIILSRGVTDSLILNNVVNKNAGSGIVLDKGSERNMVSGNLLMSNGGDGITLYESGHNVLAHNNLSNNLDSGIRIRSSQNVTLSQNRIGRHSQYCIKLTGRQGHTATTMLLDRNGCDPSTNLIRLAAVNEITLLDKPFTEMPFYRNRIKGDPVWRHSLGRALERREAHSLRCSFFR